LVFAHEPSRLRAAGAPVEAGTTSESCRIAVKDQPNGSSSILHTLLVHHEKV
jgi:hypothetical protein